MVAQPNPSTPPYSTTYNPPTLELADVTYTQDELITATCITNESQPTTSIVWTIGDANNNKVSQVTQQ